jgi:hypothetical protein
VSETQLNIKGYLVKDFLELFLTLYTILFLFYILHQHLTTLRTHVKFRYIDAFKEVTHKIVVIQCTLLIKMKATITSWLPAGIAISQVS